MIPTIYWVPLMKSWRTLLPSGVTDPGLRHVIAWNSFSTSLGSAFCQVSFILCLHNGSCKVHICPGSSPAEKKRVAVAVGAPEGSPPTPPHTRTLYSFIFVSYHHPSQSLHMEGVQQTLLNVSWNGKLFVSVQL